MIIKQLYESLIKSLNEARIQRTINKKLWLTVASICSRNKSTESEFIKPLSKMSKEEILQRYVAALLIMKKPCPETEKDIESLKTFKLFGQKYLSLNGTINDIKKLYIENGGTGVSIETTGTNTNVEKQKMEQEIKKPIEQQIVEEPHSNNDVNIDKEDIEELPEGINTYDKIFNYVNKKYKDVSNILEEIYDILDTTYFSIQKTFYKINLNNKEIIYFNAVSTNENIRIYLRDKKNIQIPWIKLNSSQLRSKEEGIINIVINDMTINDNKISNSIKLSDNISITLNDFITMCKIILSKLLYIKQEKYVNPFLLTNKQKTKINSFGSYNNKPINNSLTIDKNIFTKICKKLEANYNNFKKLYDLCDDLIVKYKLFNGNAFIMPKTFYVQAGSKSLCIKGIRNMNNNNYIITDINSQDYYWRISQYDNKNMYKQETIYLHNRAFTSTNNNYQCSENIKYTIIIRILATLLYYTNNYDLFIK